MGGPRKIIYVDFVEKKRSQPFGFGGGPKVTLAVFFLTLSALVVTVALAMPEWLLSAFFAPTAIAVSVVLALGIRRAVIRWQVGRLYRSMPKGSGGSDGGTSSGRTLH